MSIFIGGIHYELNRPQDYNSLIGLIENCEAQNVIEPLIEIHRQVLLEEATVSQQPNLPVENPSTPQHQKTNPELALKIAHLKRILEKTIKRDRTQEHTLKNPKVRRKLDFMGRTTEAPQPLSLSITESNHKQALELLAQNNCTITELTICKMDVSPVVQIFKLLPKNKQLISLTLASNFYLGVKACNSLMSILPDTNLRILRFNNCDIRKKKGVREPNWASMLRVTLPQMQSLVCLEIHGNKFDNKHDWLLEGILSSSITETNLIDKTNRQITLSEQVEQTITKTINTNRSKVLSLVNLIKNQSIKELHQLLSNNKIVLPQAIGQWGNEYQEYIGLTPLAFAILSGNRELLALILDHMTKEQILWNCNVPLNFNGQLITTSQIVCSLQSNREELFELLESHPGNLQPNDNDPNGAASAQTYTGHRRGNISTQSGLASLVLSEEAERTSQMTGPQALVVQLVRNVKKEIIEHAARRCDLAFYTFVAYYNKNLSVTLTDTMDVAPEYQGSQLGVKTDACHSALISGFEDSKREEAKAHPTRQGDTVTVKYSIFDNTDFFFSLNATVVLPRIVNDLDGKLEGKIKEPSHYRDEYRRLINMVSAGKLSPEEAMSDFFRIMQKFFRLEAEWVDEGKTSNDSPTAARALVMKYIKHGTFKYKWNTEVEQARTQAAPSDSLKTSPLFDDYLYSLLRLSPP